MGTNFDSTNLYKFLKDALYEMKEGELSSLDYAECAQILERELTASFDITKKLDEYSYPEEEVSHADANIKKYAGKSVKVTNMSDIFYILGIENKRRVKSIMDDLEIEINKGNIENNVVAANDYLDTLWLFDVLGADNDKVYLKFTGTAK